MPNQLEQHSHILYSGPSGCSYYLWSEDGQLPYSDIYTLAHELDIDIDFDKLCDGDDIENFRQFIHIIAQVSRKYGFTHIVDEEMGILIDKPRIIIEAINMYLKGWPTGAQLRILKGLDLSHLNGLNECIDNISQG